MICPHRLNGNCEIASSIALKPVTYLSEVCLECERSDRPYRVNIFTISLAGTARTLTSEELERLSAIASDEIEGFGSRLQRIFSHLGISEGKDCACPGHKDILNLWTPEYVRRNIDRVVRWLENESRKRRLPFSRTLVKRFLLHLVTDSEVSE
jgi:hypothetical protein